MLSKESWPPSLPGGRDMQNRDKSSFYEGNKLQIFSKLLSFHFFYKKRIYINWFDTIFFSPVPHLTPFSYLISLLQPPFGFDFKWKTITQITLPFLTLGEIKRVFKWWAIIKRQIMQLLDWCRNLQLLKLKPHVDISWATKILSHVWGSKMLKSLVCVMHGVLDLIPYRPMLYTLGERLV